jgi:hypothetical protein
MKEQQTNETVSAGRCCLDRMVRRQPQSQKFKLRRGGTHVARATKPRACGMDCCSPVLRPDAGLPQASLALQSVPTAARVCVFTTSVPSPNRSEFGNGPSMWSNDPGEAQRPGAPPRLEQWRSKTRNDQNCNGGALLPPPSCSLTSIHVPCDNSQRIPPQDEYGGNHANCGQHRHEEQTLPSGLIAICAIKQPQNRYGEGR